MKDIFEIKTTTLADGVEDLLLEHMVREKLHPGDILPGEDELASQLKISRHIVREGVSRLKALDIVESRRKRGMIMKRANAFVGLQKFADADLFLQEDRKELMELRIAMEIGMSAFIYAKKTPEKIQLLRRVSGIRGSAIQSFKSEIEFHSTLMEFAENKMASQFRDILIEIFKPIYKNIKLSPLSSPPTHDKICDVLEQGSMEDFCNIMLQHFQPYLKVCESASLKK